MASNRDPEEFEPETEDEEEEETDVWDDWNSDETEEGNHHSELKCLFCDLLFSSSGLLFEHCSTVHNFDFQDIRKTLELDFYDSFKLINYVRKMVVENRCWSCGFLCNSIQDLQNHLHRADYTLELKLLWEDEKYLHPFMHEDSLLHSFDEDVEEGEMELVDRMEVMRDLGYTDDHMVVDMYSGTSDALTSNGLKEKNSSSSGLSDVHRLPNEDMVNGGDMKEDLYLSHKSPRDKNSSVSFKKVSASEIRKVNESYFGSYSSYGIHREMLSDKVRMDAYRQAILDNPSLLKGAVVMDVGCGTGVLSFFAAQAGASRVIAVEASQKMAAVATQIAKDNGLLRGEGCKVTGTIEVVHGMVEELDKSLRIEPHSIDVLLSEWMGYCLLYESMLSSVLFARDRWLNPGGAILPDTATMFAAGFGKGGTSLPFWENVYGFNMTCVGKELVEVAAEAPIVDVLDSSDIVTETVVLQTFDITTMKHEDMDFTTSIKLEPSSDTPERTTWCHGIVLWFETGFTNRFCKEAPCVLSTSPYTPKTHWSQTILTFNEPIALSARKHGDGVERSAAVGSESYPATEIHIRVSIARAAEHRAIDIALETAAVSCDGSKQSFPAQIFGLC